MNVQNPSEHILLELNQSCELFVVRYQVTNQRALSFLYLQRTQSYVISFYEFFQLEDHLLAVGFRVSLVKLGVINVILIATAVNLSKLKEQFEVFELWLFQYSYNIAKLNCRCLKIAYHKDKHKKGLLERSICTYLRYFFLFKERQIELRVWSKVD